MNLRHLQKNELIIQKRIAVKKQREEAQKNLDKRGKMLFTSYPYFPLEEIHRKNLMHAAREYYSNASHVTYKGRTATIFSIKYCEEHFTDDSLYVLAMASNNKSELTFRQMNTVYHHLLFELDVDGEQFFVNRHEFVKRPHPHGPFFYCFIEEELDKYQRMI